MVLISVVSWMDLHHRTYTANVTGKLLYNNADQTPMSGYTVNLMQGAAVVATTTTLSDGSYTFPTYLTVIILLVELLLIAVLV